MRIENIDKMPQSDFDEIIETASTDKINDRRVYMNGIGHSYCYEGYPVFKTEEL